MNKQLSFALEKSNFFNKLSTDKTFLFAQVNSIPKQKVKKLMLVYNDNKPIYIVRYFILSLIADNVKITDKTIQEIKINFHNKNLNYFEKYLKNDQLNYIKKCKTKPLSAWNKFGILYDYFYILDAKFEINKDYKEIGSDIIKKFSLNNYKMKIINLQGPRNNGADSCWVSIYPKRFNRYSQAAQIYCKTESGKLYAGLYIEDKLKSKLGIDDTPLYEKVECKTYSDVLNCIESVISIEKEINNQLKLDEDFIEIKVKSKVNTKILPKYTKEDFLDEIFIDSSQYDILSELLANKKNIIFQGAPGVGKTYTAKRFAYSILGKKDDSKISVIQFHQNYSYENFIRGYEPGENHFKLGEGVFYKFCKEAEKNPAEPYFFIIDEINRGNISKIFGELLSLIEADKRGTYTELMYNGEKFCVPSNLYIIGLMNTADRSIAMIDFALRRRFAFYNFEPAFDNNNFKNYMNSKNNQTLNMIIETIKLLNEEIRNDCSLGEGFVIGHGYFCTEKAVTDNWLNCIINHEIIPLLNEYWFDDETLRTKWENKFKSALSYDAV